MGSFETNSAFCKLQFMSDVNTWQNCIFIILHTSSFTFWKKWANCNKSFKTRSGSWNAKTFLHVGKWKQGPCTQVVPAKQDVLCDAQADRAEGGLSTAEPMVEALEASMASWLPASSQHQRSQEASAWEWGRAGSHLLANASRTYKAMDMHYLRS